MIIIQQSKTNFMFFANQHRGIVKSYGKVDYIVLDSPILLSLTYRNYYKGTEYPSSLYSESFDKMVLDTFNQYDNINIVLERADGVHNNDERYQNLEESKELDVVIENSLIENNIPFHKIKVDDNTVDNIMKLIVANE